MALSFSVGNGGMLGPNMFQARRRKFGIGSLLALLLIGVVFIAVGIVIYKSTKIDPSWKRTDGTVVGAVANNSGSSGTTYAATVKYTVNGQSYQITGNTSSSSYPHNGSIKQVAYDPQQPGDAKVVAGSGLMLITLGCVAIGALMVIIAPIAFVKSIKRSENIKDLRQTGQKITGVITNIQSNVAGYQQGGRVQNQGYKVVVSATDPSGTVQTYISDTLTGIGGLAMADFRTNPIPIDVYINPSNPQDYYVDVSEVPNLTPERIKELIQSARQMGPAAFAPGATPPIAPTTNPMPPTAPVASTFPGATPPSPPSLPTETPPSQPISQG